MGRSFSTGNPSIYVLEGRPVFDEAGRVPAGGLASRSHLDAGFGRAGQAATAGRLTMGSSLIGAMLSSVM